MNAIEIKNLSKSYPGFELRDINLELPAGSIMGLVGENGAGKTTTLKLIMNAISRDSGSVKVLGVDNQAKEFNAVKEDIGVVLDEAYFPEVLTPKHVGKVMKNTYRNWDDTCYYNFLERFKLPETKAFKDFSRGMKMKLAIAVAMSHRPKLLILDEATSGLDPIVRDEILDIFNDFTRDETHSVLLSSHIVSDLEKICDYIAFIHNGRLLFCEEKDKLLEEYAIVRMSKDDFEKLPKEAVKGKKVNKYGVEALVLKSAVSRMFNTEYTTLEDIILFLAKGDRKQ
ncbi:MAG TPA: ABC transporter ATP-binding protein [Hungateiclostridium thermocellum]|jgi:ABC-2 type transport system ATP-binding protein|uniref:ABC transporter related protein n=2 Tax=Acetivibrio thermocellus TaxID=1515 RepID=A3DJN8_ACET2|nr:ABC transporter ATP-binding protein [Acetivibrio thermocellus]CDG37458.1 ABC transporter-like protein [Acetivibrio thermocellus BC1]ABN54167.1 ABC transporter related protein [Acetivibrio thermocellus ATCC 27405]ADU73604.1 ABC transporter related protein [Acetivibrio thermocellus DSM 1313]ALX07531.1 ABC transporter related protein [Acetivibrio thermocellus AD2]ANV75271.1 ABC transporter related protein [Acetivibrio thermocellus DSM 2360]